MELPAAGRQVKARCYLYPDTPPLLSITVWHIIVLNKHQQEHGIKEKESMIRVNVVDVSVLFLVSSISRVKCSVLSSCWCLVFEQETQLSARHGWPWPSGLWSWLEVWAGLRVASESISSTGAACGHQLQLSARVTALTNPSCCSWNSLNATANNWWSAGVNQLSINYFDHLYQNQSWL